MAPLQHDVDQVDSVTLNYLELVSGREGQAAIESWMRWVGWREDGKTQISTQISPERRMQRAYELARVKPYAR